MTSPADVANPLLFFFMVITLFPLGLGPDPARLATLAPGILWVVALLASLMVSAKLFASDFEDGSLEQLALAPYPLAVTALAWLEANAIPFFDDLLALIGALTSAPLTLLLPALFYRRACARQPAAALERAPAGLVRWGARALVGVASLLMVFGTAGALVDIARHWRHYGRPFDCHST